VAHGPPPEGACGTRTPSGSQLSARFISHVKMAAMALPTGTKVLRVGLRADSLDYELHPELDYHMMAARIAAAEKAL
jgi:hypothetical protein